MLLPKTTVYRRWGTIPHYTIIIRIIIIFNLIKSQIFTIEITKVSFLLLKSLKSLEIVGFDPTIFGSRCSSIELDFQQFRIEIVKLFQRNNYTY
jgi:hypothetical protein